MKQHNDELKGEGDDGGHKLQANNDWTAWRAISTYYHFNCKLGCVEDDF
jgi:hypothetical protein